MINQDEAEGPARWVKVPSVKGQIAGSWMLPESLLNWHQGDGAGLVISFFPSTPTSGRFFLADAMREQHDDEYDTSSGIEEGCYSISASNVLSVDLNPASCAHAIDTNDTAGLSHLEGSDNTIQVDEYDRLVLQDGEASVSFLRAPLQRLKATDLTGTWLVNASADQNLFVLTLDGEAGEFMFGTQHDYDDPDECDRAEYYPTELGAYSPGGNGVEVGKLQLDSSASIVTPVDVTIDTNGTCGFYDDLARQEGQPNKFLISAGQDADTLLLWTTDEDDQAGLVLRRAPSVANSIVGAWRQGTVTAPEPEMYVFLDNEVFTIAWGAGKTGIRREAYSVTDEQITLTTEGMSHCVDTTGEDSCDDPYTETLSLWFSSDGLETQIGDATGKAYKISRP